MTPLPGFAEPIIRQQEAAAEYSGQDLTKRLHYTPAGNISRATGYMESHSPLFAGTAADPQRQLFGDDPTFDS